MAVSYLQFPYGPTGFIFNLLPMDMAASVHESEDGYVTCTLHVNSVHFWKQPCSDPGYGPIFGGSLVQIHRSYHRKTLKTSDWCMVVSVLVSVSFVCLKCVICLSQKTSKAWASRLVKTASTPIRFKVNVPGLTLSLLPVQIAKKQKHEICSATMWTPPILIENFHLSGHTFRFCTVQDFEVFFTFREICLWLWKD